MPMLAIFPWAHVSSQMEFGDFVVTPYGLALQRGEIPQQSADAVEVILRGYGHSRPVDRAHVPIIRACDTAFLAELDDAYVGAYYAARTKLAFSALSARDYFGTHYCNSDSVRMDIRVFSEGTTGAVVVDRRRRDGFQTVMYPSKTYVERRPDYVNSCNLNRELDSGLLAALGKPVTAKEDVSSRLDEAVSVFVRANTDSPSVDPQSELIDTISALSRITNAHKASPVVAAFAQLLPDRIPGDEFKNFKPGRKISEPRVLREIAAGKSLRAIWLHDAFKLRHQYSHGRILQPEFTPIWTLNEHLLLSAWIFPIVVKALLVQRGIYEITREDRFRDWAFDVLLTLDAFQPEIRVPRQLDTYSKGEVDESADQADDTPKTQWQAAVNDLGIRFAGEEIRRLWTEPAGSQAAG